MIQFFPSRQIAIIVGSVPVHWYGIMYALGFILGLLLLPRLSRISRLDLTQKQADDLLLSVFLGVLLGGRLGYVLFYGLTYYLDNPSQIIAVWQGGMSSHGGFIGVILSLWLFARRRGKSLLQITDTIVVPVAIGLMLGRLGNLINGELYGTVTTLPWGMEFPGAEGLRHPTQIYAMIKNGLIAALCLLVLRKSYRAELPAVGLPSAVFLMSYAVLRFIVEIFRDQPYGFTPFLGLSLSRGQLLTLPVLALGIAVLLFTRRRSS